MNAFARMRAKANKPSAGGRGRRHQRGFTILEIAVAMTVLSAGSAVLWYGLRSSAKMDKLNRLHHTAALLARSDLESLRSIPKADIHDTLYLASGEGESLLVVRRVMDSARIVNSLSELVLDDKLSPKEVKKPLEVRVKVWRLPKSGNGSAPDASALQDPESQGAKGSEEGADADGPHRLVAFIIKLPEYKWY